MKSGNTKILKFSNDMYPCLWLIWLASLHEYFQILLAEAQVAWVSVL